MPTPTRLKLHPALTAGEALLMQRRRRDQDQFAAAKRCGVARATYQQWEMDLVAAPEHHVARAREAVGALRDYEACMLLRRRFGLSAFEMGKLVGLSRQWVSTMERGSAPADTLIEYWTVHAPHP